MPERKTIEESRRARRRGLSPSTQAGPFVRQEIRHVRSGKHGARSVEQAIAIGLSEARRAGVPLPPRPGSAPRTSGRRPARTEKAERRRWRAGIAALRREPRGTVTSRALSEHARRAAGRRTAAERRAAALRGAETRSPRERRRAGLRAAETRRRRAKRAGAAPRFGVRVGARIVRDDFLTREGAARHARKVGGRAVRMRGAGG